MFIISHGLRDEGKRFLLRHSGSRERDKSFLGQKKCPRNSFIPFSTIPTHTLRHCRTFLRHSRPDRESPCQVGMRNALPAKIAGWFGGLDLRMAAGAGVLGFPVLPGKPRAPQAPEIAYSGAGAAQADLRRRCRKSLQTGNGFRGSAAYSVSGLLHLATPATGPFGQDITIFPAQFVCWRRLRCFGCLPLRSIPPTSSLPASPGNLFSWVPPVYEATGGHGHRSSQPPPLPEHKNRKKIIRIVKTCIRANF